MALRYVEYKRRQWVLRFRDPWSGKQRVRSFFTEAEAKAFEAVQAELYTRERELIRRARRRTSSASATRATVAELLGWYMETLENPTTRATSQQHVEPLTAIFGHRRAHCLTCMMSSHGAKYSASAASGNQPSTAASPSCARHTVGP